MTISSDYIIERRQYQSKLRIWKLVTIGMFIISMIITTSRLGLTDKLWNNNDYIASVLIEDIIYEDAWRDSRLKKIIDDNQIKALIVKVNSPGGTVVGSEQIYNILRKISAQKPVVIVMGTLAASGGYLISLGGDYIISHNGTITGSIGVIFQMYEITELADKLGIKFHSFKSGELKAAPNQTEKVTDSVRQAVMSDIQDTYDYFVELVAIRRNLTIEEVYKIADGRIYTGRQALKLKLVDAIGSEDTAVEWLQNIKKIAPIVKVKEFRITPKPTLLQMMLEASNSTISSFLKNKFQGLKAIF